MQHTYTHTHTHYLSHTHIHTLSLSLSLSHTHTHSLITHLVRGGVLVDAEESVTLELEAVVRLGALHRHVDERRQHRQRVLQGTRRDVRMGSGYASRKPVCSSIPQPRHPLLIPSLQQIRRGRQKWKRVRSQESPPPPPPKKNQFPPLISHPAWPINRGLDQSGDATPLDSSCSSWPVCAPGARREVDSQPSSSSRPFHTRLALGRRGSGELTLLQSVTNPPGTSLGSSGFLCWNLQNDVRGKSH